MIEGLKGVAGRIRLLPKDERRAFLTGLVVVPGAATAAVAGIAPASGWGLAGWLLMALMSAIVFATGRKVLRNG